MRHWDGSPLGRSDMFIQPTVRLESTFSRCRHVSHPNCGTYMKRLLTGHLGRINQCEGWNNRFFHLVGYKLPSIWTLVEVIQMENRKVVTLIAQDLIGQPPRKRILCQYVSLQTRLLTLCQDRVTGRRTLGEFPTGIWHNIRWTPSN